jgi:hypothetical protein
MLTETNQHNVTCNKLNYTLQKLDALARAAKSHIEICSSSTVRTDASLLLSQMIDSVSEVGRQADEWIFSITVEEQAT